MPSDRSDTSAAEEVARLRRQLSEAHGLIVQAESAREEMQERHAAEVASLRAEVEALRTSRTVRLALAGRSGVRRILPAGSRRGEALTAWLLSAARTARAVRSAASARRTSPGRTSADGVDEVQEAFDEQYRRWIARRDPSSARLAALREEAAVWDDAPLVSVVMTAYQSEPSWFDAAVQSVVDQAYPRWELCIADDCSPATHVPRLLKDWAARDPRIRYTRRDHNGGIAAASATALELATGDLVALMDHDDVLPPHALWTVVDHVRRHPGASLVYSDHDILLTDGRRARPYLKGDHSDDLLLANNHVAHLLVAPRRALIEVGGFRAGFDGSQDHDLALRLAEHGRVDHIPEVLYSWRQVPGSVTMDFGSKPDAWDAGVRAVRAALERRAVDGTAERGNLPGWVRVRRRIAGRPRVTAIVPTRDRADLLATCMLALQGHDDVCDLDIVVVDNDSQEQRTHDLLERLVSQGGVRVLQHPGPFEYAAMMNRAAAQASGDHLLLLNNDVEAIEPGWLEALLEHAQRSDVGAVGARLLHADGAPQHEGVRVGDGSMPRNMDTGGYMNLGRTTRDVTAVTAACMLTPRHVWESLGGLDERLRVVYNDVDYCLRVRAAGLRVIYQPLAELRHDESRSRGRLLPADEVALFAERYGDPSEIRDPFWSPHLAGYAPPTLRHP